MRKDQRPEQHAYLIRYPPHTLAPDPHQPELDLRPPQEPVKVAHDAKAR